MKLRCPTCHTPLDGSHTCLEGHRFPVQDGVLRLLDADYRQQLEAFTENFSRLRAAEERRILEPAIYPRLPDALSHDPEWLQRTYDLALLRRLLHGQKGLSVLDVGAWNGWLCHRLVEMGHRPTAIDYFVDPYDGLAAKQHYPTDWQAIQMDLEDLSVLDARFDVVLLNRAVQFFVDPPAYIEGVRAKVAPGGILVLLGLAFFRDPRHKVQGIRDLRTHFNDHGFDFFKPVRGYLDLADKGGIEALGVRLSQYPQLRVFNLKSILFAASPRHYYGVWP